jgi:hypothetical protein
MGGNGISGSEKARDSGNSILIILERGWEVVGTMLILVRESEVGFDMVVVFIAERWRQCHCPLERVSYCLVNDYIYTYYRFIHVCYFEPIKRIKLVIIYAYQFSMLIFGVLLLYSNYVL